MWGEVSLPRRQFSNGCQNSKRVYPLTEQFHFWKRSLDIGLHVLKAIDLKAKQSHMYKKKKQKRMAQQRGKTGKNPEIVPFACQIRRPSFTLLRASGSRRVTKTTVPSPSDSRSSSVVQSLDRVGKKRKKWRYFPPAGSPEPGCTRVSRGHGSWQVALLASLSRVPLTPLALDSKNERHPS